MRMPRITASAPSTSRPSRPRAGPEGRPRPRPERFVGIAKLIRAPLQIGDRRVRSLRAGWVWGVVWLLHAAPVAVSAQPPSLTARASFPQIARGTPYDRVRATLIRAGWTPLALAAPGQCGWDVCPPYREVLSCGASVSDCSYAWRMGNQYVLVNAGGEGHPQVFTDYQRCSTITRDLQYPLAWNCNPVSSSR